MARLLVGLFVHVPNVLAHGFLQEDSITLGAKDMIAILFSPGSPCRFGFRLALCPLFTTFDLYGWFWGPGKHKKKIKNTLIVTYRNS